MSAILNIFKYRKALINCGQLHWEKKLQKRELKQKDTSTGGTPAHELLFISLNLPLPGPKEGAAEQLTSLQGQSHTIQRGPTLPMGLSRPKWAGKSLSDLWFWPPNSQPVRKAFQDSFTIQSSAKRILPRTAPHCVCMSRSEESTTVCFS
jgi:hypothetical protein